MNDLDVIYFNNCNGRDHKSIFGDKAFFDLGMTGTQYKQALNLPVGQECVVASYSEDDRVVFDWFALTYESVISDNEDIACRVFWGDLLSTDTLQKSEAAEDERYSAFFDVTGRFKRHSVISGKVSDLHRPRTKLKKETYCAEEIDIAGTQFIEGTTRRITVNTFERNASARTACIQHYGTTCCICNFDFGIIYGSEAQGYIHVHHLKPLSEISSSYEVDPKTDLRPVCPNCHAVLHMGGITRSIDDVREMLKANSK